MEKPLATPAAPLHTLFGQLERRRQGVLLLLGVLLLGAVLYSTSVGTVSIGPNELATIFQNLITRHDATGTALSTNAYIVMQVRLPRIVAAVITGLALAMGGAIMQAVLRNPLASPFTLGVSSGASFGAALAIVIGFSVFNNTLEGSGRVVIALNAFLFGCLSLAIVYAVAQVKQGSTAVLLLAGVAVSSIFGAGVSALHYFSNNEALRDLTVWLMGGFWGANWQSIAILAPLTVIALVILMRYAWDLNAAISGEEVAETLGVHIQRVRVITLVTVTLIASAAIAFSGVIGFVGLVAPHVARSFIGSDNRYLIPASALTGSVFVLLSDTLARTVIAPIEIPVGIITSLVGGPFFIYILLVRDRASWG